MGLDSIASWYVDGLKSLQQGNVNNNNLAKLPPESWTKITLIAVATFLAFSLVCGIGIGFIASVLHGFIALGYETRSEDQRAVGAVRDFDNKHLGGVLGSMARSVQEAVNNSRL